MQLGRRLQRMNLRVRELAADRPAARLASAILFLAEEQGEIKTGLITANFRQHRMARAAGIDPISMNELLKEWSSAGYIEVDRQRLLLHDVKAMQKIAGWE
jgi:CRP-like cAMP-binding protein